MKFLILLGCLALAKGQLFGLGNQEKVQDITKNPVFKLATAKIAHENPDFLGNVENFAKALEGARSMVEGYLDKTWGSFKDTLHKTYSSAEEETLRKEIFINNIKRLSEFTGELPFEQKLNEFADLLHHEFHTEFNGFNRVKTGDNVKPTEKPGAFKPPADKPIPESFDWREHGAVTPIKFQNSCAGCYAFSAAGALEGQFFRKTGDLKELSVQNLIDCTQDYGNDGCQGGLMDPAFQYIKDNAGVNPEKLYPFEAKDGMCRYKNDTSAGMNQGFVTIPSGDEKALKIAVATVGPVSAAIDASPESFQFYANGVYHDPDCKNDIESMNHAVLVVGYGAEPDGKKYWLVKNSYGTKWGMEGYVKMARDSDNHCGIATIASYPTVD